MIIFHIYRSSSENFKENRLVFENGKPAPVPPTLPSEEKPPMDIPKPDPAELDQMIEEAQDVFKNAEKAAKLSESGEKWERPTVRQVAIDNREHFVGPGAIRVGGTREMNVNGIGVKITYENDDRGLQMFSVEGRSGVMKIQDMYKTVIDVAEEKANQ